jgi:hypothetical protein
MVLAIRRFPENGHDLGLRHAQLDSGAVVGRDVIAWDRDVITPDRDVIGHGAIYVQPYRKKQETSCKQQTTDTQPEAFCLGRHALRLK